MRMTRLGQTDLQVSSTAFGCLPIQRIDMEAAVQLLQVAKGAGINFFDTARAYSDSEAKMGRAFAGQREAIIIATKTGAHHAEGFWRDLNTSLASLQTDYIDIYQFHNPPFVPVPGGEDGLYDAALEAKAKGLIRHIGITQHSIDRAEEAVRSGLYETLQYPFNHLATKREIALAALCREKDVGFICMKALSGGLVTDAAVPFAYFTQYPQVVPIWGFQRMRELENVLALEANPPALDTIMLQRIKSDQVALGGAFCRSCGYCLPCPVDIPIPNANRMRELMTRSPSAQWMTPEWQAAMERIDDCIHCGACHTRCPYGLAPYETMPGQLAFYREYVRTHG